MPHRLTVSQRIARDIHEQISRRSYRPGERLPTERELAIHYGVSRIPVREAMKTLEQRGLVEARHGSGNYVRHIDENKIIEQIAQYVLLCESDIHELGAFWNILERQAVAAAALNRTDRQCELIRQLADDCAAEIKSAITGQPYAFNETDYALHSSIAGACGNKVMSNLVSVFHKSLRLKQSLVGSRPEELGKLISIHDALVKGIERKDPEMAMLAIDQDLALGKKLLGDFSGHHELAEVFGN